MGMWWKMWLNTILSFLFFSFLFFCFLFFCFLFFFFSWVGSVLFYFIYTNLLIPVRHSLILSPISRRVVGLFRDGGREMECGLSEARGEC